LEGELGPSANYGKKMVGRLKELVEGGLKEEFPRGG